MESNRPESRISLGLPIAYMLKHHGYLGLKAGNKLGDLVKPPVNHIKTSPQGSHIGCHLAVDIGSMRTAPEHGIETPWLPAQGDRQRFQGSRAASPLNGVQLNFPHHRRRDTRTLRELSLSPAKLTDAVTDHLGDRNPVFFRHAFRHASSSAFRFHCRD